MARPNPEATLSRWLFFEVSSGGGSGTRGGAHRKEGRAGGKCGVPGMPTVLSLHLPNEGGGAPKNDV